VDDHEKNGNRKRSVTKGERMRDKNIGNDRQLGSKILASGVALMASGFILYKYLKK
jgi:hypothetical protein